MEIESLKLKYPLVYEAAIINQHNEEDKGSYPGNEVINSFGWWRAPEGDDFWCEIDENDFKSAKKRKPNLFTTIGNYFEKGDYVVLLHGCNEAIPNTWEHSMPVGHVYRLKEKCNKNIFSIEKGINSTPKRWCCESYRDSKLLLRGATEEEIKKYNELGEPFHIDTIYNRENILKNNNLNLDKDGRNIEKIDKERISITRQTRGEVITSSSRRRSITIESRLIGNKVFFS